MIHNEIQSSHGVEVWMKWEKVDSGNLTQVKQKKMIKGQSLKFKLWRLCDYQRWHIDTVAKRGVVWKVGGAKAAEALKAKIQCELSAGSSVYFLVVVIGYFTFTVSLCLSFCLYLCVSLCLCLSFSLSRSLFLSVCLSANACLQITPVKMMCTVLHVSTPSGACEVPKECRRPLKAG